MQDERDSLKKCSLIRKRIDEHIYKIGKSDMDYCVKNSEEHVATYKVFEVWKDYLFLLNGVLFRWDDCIRLLEEILKDFDFILEKPDDNSVKEDMVFSGNWKTDIYSYRFEDFIVSFSRLNESVLMSEISRALPKELRETVTRISYKKSDVNGLYWRVNLLRNKSAHSSKGAYTAYNDKCARYMSFSSRIFRIVYNDGKFQFNTTLFDLSKSQFAKDTIKREIIDGGSDKPVMDILFPQDSPKGHGKSNPIMLFMDKYPFFDLNEGFLSLSLVMLEYIENQLMIFEKAVGN